MIDRSRHTRSTDKWSNIFFFNFPLYCHETATNPPPDPPQKIKLEQKRKSKKREIKKPSKITDIYFINFLSLTYIFLNFSQTQSSIRYVENPSSSFGAQPNEIKNTSIEGIVYIYYLTQSRIYTWNHLYRIHLI